MAAPDRKLREASRPAGSFAPVPRRLLDDSRVSDPTTIAIYAALSSFVDYDTGDCFPSYTTIGERARCNARTAQRHVELLVALRHVIKKRTGRANKYHLTDPWGRNGPGIRTDTGYQSDETPVTNQKIPDRTRSTIRSDTHDNRDTPPVSDKRDSLNEIQERKRDLHEARTSATPRSSQALAASIPFSLRSSMKEVARKAVLKDISYMDSEVWWVEVYKETMKKGATEGPILECWKLCLATRPDKARFFAKDYSRYAEQRMNAQREELAKENTAGELHPDVLAAIAKASQKAKPTEKDLAICRGKGSGKLRAWVNHADREDPDDTSINWAFIAAARFVLAERAANGGRRGRGIRWDWPRVWRTTKRAL